MSLLLKHQHVNTGTVAIRLSQILSEFLLRYLVKTLLTFCVVDTLHKRSITLSTTRKKRNSIKTPNKVTYSLALQKQLEKNSVILVRKNSTAHLPAKHTN